MGIDLGECEALAKEVDNWVGSLRPSVRVLLSPEDICQCGRLLRKPRRLTFFHRNQVRRTGFEFVSAGISVETNSIPVRRTRFLRKKVSLRGFRSCNKPGAYADNLAVNQLLLHFHIFIFFVQWAQSWIRAIPFEILREAEWKISATQRPPIFLFVANPSLYIFYSWLTFVSPRI